MSEIKKNVMFTGAPATGKTTLLEKASQVFRLEIVPDHTTRPIRTGEVHGVEKLFITVEEFIRNFDNGWYLQREIEQTKYNGNYYGSPIDWVNRANSGEGIGFVSVSVDIAEKIKLATTENVLWVHLVATEEARHMRLHNRTLSEAEKRFRLSGAQTDTLELNNSDLVIDTSSVSLRDSLEMVDYYLKNK